MTVRLYLDHNIDGVVADQLALRGVDVLLAQKDGHASMTDAALFERATELDRVMVSEDRDFRVLAGRYIRASHHFAGLISVLQRGWHRGRIIDEIATLALTGDPEDFVNRIYYV